MTTYNPAKATQAAKAARAALDKFNAAREAFEADMSDANERAMEEAGIAFEATQDVLTIANCEATVN